MKRVKSQNHFKTVRWKVETIFSVFWPCFAYMTDPMLRMTVLRYFERNFRILALSRLQVGKMESWLKTCLFAVFRHFTAFEAVFGT